MEEAYVILTVNSVIVSSTLVLPKSPGNFATETARLDFLSIHETR